ncbi:type I-E CRISPR-associated protein Cse1/CasA [Streptomyces sp. SP18CS02]|uniref:type I-E CRISPR-associated protein Cse1/CasA n=1 Tax=Streptomyces sp. SP18CS02 TaxID=3002531 RepID=UPI002E76552D|nr:type I-E CRISPR-associated protein Cse1/CasA [Streptomyces sp. SP18CS02]MEE1753541.1 type I-E CRISPR-associated protein Cse1/CasA [Streptomyces sp. SP18CS02]
MRDDQVEAVGLGDLLTGAARTVWAKHDPDFGKWLPLWRHLADSAAVAGLLWDRWLPRGVKTLVAEALPDGEEDGRRLCVWLSGTHDIGKCTPAFACQVDELADVMRGAGLGMRTRRQFGDDRRAAPHGLAGHVLLQEWLEDRHGWSRRSSAQFAIVAGGHHGVPPDHAQIHHVDAHPELLRTPGPAEAVWRRVQNEVLDACAQVFGVEERLALWQKVKLPQPVQVLLTAVVIVADWIASNPDLFPYMPEDVPRNESERVAAAWKGLRLPPPWEPAEPGDPAEELFSKRFALPPGARVRPVQERAVAMARTMPRPGMLVIEAPMGEGKTEAALAVAEVFAARSGAGGCYIALPTMATGNAMFPRLLAWLDRLPPTGSGSTGERSVFLAHAKAALQDDYAGLLRDGHRTIAAVDAYDNEHVPPGIRRENRTAPADLVAHQWLRGRKKGLLASFAVGTIDQLLMTGLKSRHLALRHLAMAGKVVVIDEVHAYDAYMNAYLDRVLSWLGAYRVPVVVLSATLPASRRRELVEAYDGTDAEAVAEATGYPLLTAVCPGTAPVVETPPASGRRTDVVLEPLADDDATLSDLLARELADGGCALVVRNTVDRVTDTAAALRERFGADHVTVAHARYVDIDRARKDASLLDRFGPPERDGTSPRRPEQAHIVVASQVAEQSLDVDFDLLVTDLCPADLLLQRMGRLHRHPRGEEQRLRPPGLRRPRCFVTGVDWRARPAPEPVGGSCTVYGAHSLLRSLAVLAPHLGAPGTRGRPVRLPEDISPLVQRAYGEDDPSPDHWAGKAVAARAEYERKRAVQQRNAEVFRLEQARADGRPLIGWIDAGVGDADDSRAGRAQVRDSRESLEVLVVTRRADGTLCTLPWLDRGRGGLDLPTDTVPSPRAARAAAASGLRLPYHFAFPGELERALADLEQLYVPAWQSKESHWLAGELILPLDEDGRTSLAGWDLAYDPDEGLLLSRHGPARRKKARMVKRPTFDLVNRPWLPVRFRDGREGELSLLEVFDQARDIRRIVGDLPTQDFALLRLLLAILHDALGGPEARAPAPTDIDAWEELWLAEAPFSPVADYFLRHRESFDLLHPERPFFQVAGLRTAKDEVFSLNRLVADVPNGDPFFSMRMPGADRLGFAEAARWLVHAQAFDPSGIKSGAVGDPRVKAGKGYPQGVGWAGNLGGVLAEGDTLHETLLLNLMAADTAHVRFATVDRPAWRAPDCGPAEAADLAGRPYGLRDLYTWQSRRIRLHHDAEGVHGVVLAYGDRLEPHNKQGYEPMTAWRRSPAQEKKRGEPQVYLPQEHDPAHMAWRGLRGLITGREQVPEQRHGAAARLRPRIVEWVARLSTEGYLPRRHLIRIRAIGARYGTQQSVIDEVVDDGVLMSVVLLHREDPQYGETALDALSDAEKAVLLLGDLAADLAEASGAPPEPRKSAALDLGFGTLDTPYRRWLRDLGSSPDPYEQRDRWKRELRGLVLTMGTRLLDEAGSVVWEGRLVDAGGRRRWMSGATAELRFRSRLGRLLTTAFDGPVPLPSTPVDDSSLPPLPSIPEEFPA